jgi:hypothetical protein
LQSDNPAVTTIATIATASARTTNFERWAAEPVSSSSSICAVASECMQRSAGHRFGGVHNYSAAFATVSALTAVAAGTCG